MPMESYGFVFHEDLDKTQNNTLKLSSYFNLSGNFIGYFSDHHEQESGISIGCSLTEMFSKT